MNWYPVLLRWTLASGAAALALLVGGFFVFCATIPRADHNTHDEVAEAIAHFPVHERAIVVLTGERGGRIQEGLNLGATGIADRILISGVNPDTTKEDLSAMGSMAMLDCCVDLGPMARSTRDNAIEARDWLEDRQYKAALLVTSDFHLPRARAELRRVVPDIEIIGVPVASELAPEKAWMSRVVSWRVLGKEYLKFLVVSLRLPL
ncbi:MAG: YdcF family protein [Pseudomonadota bacterium]